MEFDPNIHSREDNSNESISLREIVEKYLVHYKLFLLSTLVFVSLAFLRYSRQVPSYKSTAAILIKDKEKGNSINDLSSFEDLGLFGTGDNRLENEIQILMSRRLMTKVVKELKLNFSYFLEDSPYDKEFYPNFPIVLQFLEPKLDISKVSSTLRVSILSDSLFEIFGSDEMSQGKYEFGQEFEIDLGNKDNSFKAKIIILRNENFGQTIKDKNIIITIRPLDLVVSSYMAKVEIEPVDQRLSKVIQLSINESIIEKGNSVLNNLIDQYNADGIADKDEVAQTTIDFLDLRIGLLSNELSTIEETAQQYRTRNRMVDGSIGSDIYLQSSSANESELMEVNTQRELVGYILEEINNNVIGELLPANIGISDGAIISMISEYNSLILQRKRILKSSSERNPIIVNLDSQLEVLRGNLVGSLNSIKSSLEIRANALYTRSGKINTRIASVPKNEMELKDIVRHLETKNTLYLFLLQKREESVLSNAVKVEKAKIIDEAFSDGTKVSPNKITTSLGALILGIGIPFLVLYFRELLDTKVHGEKDVARIRVPYIGDIPLSSSKEKLFVNESDNSSLAESFRYLRTNLNFILDDKYLGKTIFVTSTESKEGKTFSAINLASSLAISGKKTILVAMDLRAPKISNYLDLELNTKLGVTNYLKYSDIRVEDIISKEPKIKNMDFMSSGDIPPNPVELLMSTKLNFLFETLQNSYEYVIVDTAPVGMVTDTLQIAKFADLTLYVIRANYLDKRKLHIPEKLARENRLKNMLILINGSDHSRGAYGYGYGYGYGDRAQKKSWYRRFFKSAAM
jgi:capsular exopolysaccharide synthesis family protein